MLNLEDIIKKLPADMQEMARIGWNALPVSQKSGLVSLLRGIPGEKDMIRTLLAQARTQARQAFGGKHSIAIVGPANVGKSTLYNQLVLAKEDRGEVSPVPGTTRVNQQADAGLFTLVDTPGADAVGTLGEKERQEALSAARTADFLIIVFDAIQGVKKTEQELFAELMAFQKPYVVALNKIDLVRRDEKRVIEQAAENLGIPADQLIPVAAKDGRNLTELLLSVAMIEPEMVAALGQALPQYRWALAWRTIVRAASLSGAIALTPLPVVDFAPLIAIQVMMVLGIARIYDYRITPQRARELLVTFGIGFLGRTLFEQLSKLGGVPGWVLSSAIAASTTIVMGLAAARWFDKGERLSRDTLDRLTRELTGVLVQRIKGIARRKPSKESLQEQITGALADTDLAQGTGFSAEGDTSPE